MNPTPGPWVISRHQHHWAQILDNTLDMHAEIYGPSEETVMANTRLIAAACNAIQNAHISIEALERNPQLLAQMKVEWEDILAALEPEP